jgi:Ca-activated chloride channel family protein
VAFARYPYLVSPLTLNHAWLMRNLERLKPGLVEDGTAIGSAIGMCVNRLRDLTSKSRIVILLTDGVSNAGSISPLIAAESAASLKTKVYTIAAGAGGVVPALYLNKQGEVARNIFGEPDVVKSIIPVDETTLKSIAEMTGAKFFRATTLKQLKEIYSEIDTLEKTKVKLRQYAVYREIFMPFVIAALILLAIEQLLANVLFRRVP